MYWEEFWVEVQSEVNKLRQSTDGQDSAMKRGNSKAVTCFNIVKTCRLYGE